MSGGKVKQRVRLISTSKPEAGVRPGDTGVIWRVVPSNGVLRVRWDSGVRLDLDPGEDEWEVIE
jgi:hypothetical protein